MITPLDEQTAGTVAAVARFNAAFDQRDVDGGMAAITEDCVFENTGPAPDGERYEGATAVRLFWQRFFQSNPQARFVTEDQFAAGDRCVVLWRYDWGTTAQLSESSQAEVHHVRGVDVFRVRGGRWPKSWHPSRDNAKQRVASAGYVHSLAAGPQAGGLLSGPVAPVADAARHAQSPAVGPIVWHWFSYHGGVFAHSGN